MARRALVGLVPAVVLTVGLSAPAPAAGQIDTRTTTAFLQGLRDRGYHDLAAEYLEQLRTQPGAPPELLDTIDYELGRLLIDEASKTGDLVRRKELLDQARARLDAFTRSHGNHPKAPDASLQVGRLLVERGSLAMLQAGDTEDKAEKAAKQVEARAALEQARSAFDAADKAFTAAHAKLPLPNSDNDPRRPEFERTLFSLMDAELQKGLVDYELGLTYPPGSKERTDQMNKALPQFEALFKSYRTQRGGLAAQMWQGKCFEERGGEGDLGKAIGIYNDLLGHPDPRLRPFQRHVGYFKIVALGKRKEYALAADESVRWLQANNTPDLLRSKEGLGVQLELAKDVIAQLPEIKNEADHAAAMKRITDSLGTVVRYSSPFKAEALKLLKEYKPNAAASAAEVSRLNYDDALAQGEQALAAHEWNRAGALLRQAIRRADAARDVEKTNYARYNLAFVNYMDKRYYEAAVLAEHLARRYPRAGLAAKSAEIGMASLAEAYNTYVEVDRTSDLTHLVDLANYTAATFPELEQGDTARMTLGQIYHGTGRYTKAIETYEAVRPKSARRVEARTRAGASHWQYSQALRASGKTTEADAEVGKALAVLDEALKARRETGAPATDPGLVGNACDIADVRLETSRADEALKLLTPLAKDPSAAAGPAYPRLMATLLRAHVAVSQVDLALADMAALEKTGGGAGMTQLYFNLGKLLQKEMDALKKKGDTTGLKRTQQAYFKFLSALTASKSGQTYESLQWAGENMLNLGNATEAEAVFEQILKTYGKDDKFLAQPSAADKLLRTRLKLAAALRTAHNFGEAESLVGQLIQERPNTIETMMEKGMLVEEKAVARKVSWATAFAQWRTIATRLGGARTKPLEYFEAWYHAALALKNDGKTLEARQTLASVMRLSRSVGGPEMRQKYMTMLEQLK
jgi:cellulose synthase operon protein C